MRLLYDYDSLPHIICALFFQSLWDWARLSKSLFWYIQRNLGLVFIFAIFQAALLRCKWCIVKLHVYQVYNLITYMDTCETIIPNEIIDKFISSKTLFLCPVSSCPGKVILPLSSSPRMEALPSAHRPPRCCGHLIFSSCILDSSSSCPLQHTEESPVDLGSDLTGSY